MKSITLKLILDSINRTTLLWIFFRSHCVLPRAVTCPRCNIPCNLNANDGLWRCPGNIKLKKKKKVKRCCYKRSDYKGTFLHRSHLEPWKVLLFANQFLSKHWDHNTVVKCLGISRRTSVDWRSFCSEVCEKWFQDQDPIGGEGVKVEIDETHIVKLKYHRGHDLVLAGV